MNGDAMAIDRETLKSVTRKIESRCTNLKRSVQPENDQVNKFSDEILKHGYEKEYGFIYTSYEVDVKCIYPKRTNTTL